MNKIEVFLNDDDQVPEGSKEVNINEVTDYVSKNIEETTGDRQTMTEKQVEEENAEKNDDEVVPSATPKPIDDQENVTASFSPDRTNLSFRAINGIENINKKKRELDNEDGQVQEKIVDKDGSTKKIKVVDVATVETKESDIINGTPVVEVK